jgi:hypothetical protein
VGRAHAAALSSSYNRFSVPFLPCACLSTARAHKILHYGVIVVGVLSGWIAILGNQALLAQGAIRNAASAGLVLSMFFFVLYAATACLCSPALKERHKRWRLLLEYFSLYFYLVTLLYSSIASSDILTSHI